MILVTGASGFIGRHLVQALIENDFEVLAFIPTSSVDSVDLRKIELIFGDIRNREEFDKAVKYSDIIFHLAAFGVDVAQSVDDPITTFDVNVKGTLHILESARKYNVERVIFTSSSSVYGHPRYTPIDENHPINPVHPYAASKAAAEHACLSYYRMYGLPVVCLRLSAVYGRGGHTHIDNFIKSIFNDSPIVIPGDISQSRTYTYIKDCVMAFYVCLTRKGIEGEVINIAGPEHIDLNTILRKLFDIMGKKKEILDLKVVHKDLSSLDQKRTKYKPIDINKAKRVLGYRPAYNLEKGLSDYITQIMKELGGMEHVKGFC